MFMSSSTSSRKVIFFASLISALMGAVVLISSTEWIAAEEIVDEADQSKELEFFENSIAPILNGGEAKG